MSAGGTVTLTGAHEARYRGTLVVGWVLVRLRSVALRVDSAAAVILSRQAPAARRGSRFWMVQRIAGSVAALCERLADVVTADLAEVRSASVVAAAVNAHPLGVRTGA